ncbi:MAG TPA: hypothetical protein PKM84_01650 [Candidatus Pacearchaeota archaeon]|nr:hypothetical protein [Candidatus Pacearchaeota archaeon]
MSKPTDTDKKIFSAIFCFLFCLAGLAQAYTNSKICWTGSNKSNCSIFTKKILFACGSNGVFNLSFGDTLEGTVTKYESLETSLNAYLKMPRLACRISWEDNAKNIKNFDHYLVRYACGPYSDPYHVTVKQKTLIQSGKSNIALWNVPTNLANKCYYCRIWINAKEKGPDSSAKTIGEVHSLPIYLCNQTAQKPKASTLPLSPSTIEAEMEKIEKLSFKGKVDAANMGRQGNKAKIPGISVFFLFEFPGIMPASGEEKKYNLQIAQDFEKNILSPAIFSASPFSNGKNDYHRIAESIANEDGESLIKYRACASLNPPLFSSVLDYSGCGDWKTLKILPKEKNFWVCKSKTTKCTSESYKTYNDCILKPDVLSCFSANSAGAKENCESFCANGQENFYFCDEQARCASGLFSDQQECEAKHGSCYTFDKTGEQKCQVACLGNYIFACENQKCKKLDRPISPLQESLQCGRPSSPALTINYLEKTIPVCYRDQISCEQNCLPKYYFECRPEGKCQPLAQPIPEQSHQTGLCAQDYLGNKGEIKAKRCFYTLKDCTTGYSSCQCLVNPVLWKVKNQNGGCISTCEYPDLNTCKTENYYCTNDNAQCFPCAAKKNNRILVISSSMTDISNILGDFPKYEIAYVLYKNIDSKKLKNYDTIVLFDYKSCSGISSGIKNDLVNWTANGGKLVIYDQDSRQGNINDFSWLPSPFFTKTLGNKPILDKNGDKIEYQTAYIAQENNNITDEIDLRAFSRYSANYILPASNNLCGDIKSTITGEKETGYTNAYLRHGKGIIIFNGIGILDRKFGNDALVQTSKRIFTRELSFGWDQTNVQNCSLECRQKVPYFGNLVIETLPSKNITQTTFELKTKIISAYNISGDQELDYEIIYSDLYGNKISYPSPLALAKEKISNPISGQETSGVMLSIRSDVFTHLGSFKYRSVISDKNTGKLSYGSWRPLLPSETASPFSLPSSGSELKIELESLEQKNDSVIFNTKISGLAIGENAKIYYEIFPKSLPLLKSIIGYDQRLSNAVFSYAARNLIIPNTYCAQAKMTTSKNRQAAGTLPKCK